MPIREKVHIYLEDDLRHSAQNGQHNFLGLVRDVLTDAGFETLFEPMQDRSNAAGLTLTHMKPPATARGLVFRRAYHYPFWQIDQTDQRWHWDVAYAAFDPADIPQPEARRFQRFWRKRLFGDAQPIQGDAIYVPLQGRISEHRSFQSCAPLDMVRAVLSATDRPVIVTLHPKETYTNADMRRLEALGQSHANMSLHTGGMQTFLPSCHKVVTMNSSAAFNGYFFDKPAVLFAQIDFHHIATAGVFSELADALERPARKGPFSKYLWWYWQQQSINAGRPEAKQKIRARLARFGWLS